MKQVLMFFLFLCLLCIIQPRAQAGCEDIAPTRDDFQVVTIASGDDYPMDLDIAEDGTVFYLEKIDYAKGKGYVHAAFPDGQKKEVLELDVFYSPSQGRRPEDFGLVGIVLDPDFNTTGWIYLYYHPYKPWNQLPGLTGIMSRWTWDGNVIDPQSEKVILTIPCDGLDHAGGSLTFGPEGNLWFSIGDDTYSQAYNQNSPVDWAEETVPCHTAFMEGYNSDSHCAADGARSAGNTNDLRGKVNRITLIRFPDSETPEPGIGTTYEIPEGNLFPPGEFPADKTRPEIYTMGHRNPDRISVDPETGWLFIGEGGPRSVSNSLRGPFGHEEGHIVTRAEFHGWPYFNANNLPYTPWDFDRNEATGDTWDPSVLVMNLSPRNTGLVEIPILPTPAKLYHADASVHSWSHSYFDDQWRDGCTPIGGPRYHYKNYNGSTIKLPPYYDGKWIYTDSDGQFIAVVTLNDTGGVEHIEDFPIRPGTYDYLDLELGPDGAMYLGNWAGSAPNSRIQRFEYIGGCTAKVGCPDSTYEEYDPTRQYDDMAMCQTPKPVSLERNVEEPAVVPAAYGTFILNSGHTVVTLPAGMNRVVFYNLEGKVMGEYRRNGKTGDMPAGVPEKTGNGLVYVKFLP
jgi:glucose/arabinose dehydrogenase